MEAALTRHGLRVRIANVGIAFAAGDESLVRDVAGHYQGFLDDSAPADLTIDAQAVPGLRVDPPSEEQRGQPWLDVSACGERFRIKRLDFDGELDPARGVASLRCRPRALAVDGFLRICFSLLLIRQGGLLLHAASVASRGRAHVFTGPSGAGKTTVCRLSGERTVLTDETTIVRPNGRGFVTDGNPFPGELARFGPNASFPLASINLLAKDSTTAVTPLPRGEAIRALLANTFLHARNTDLGALAFDAACAIADQVPVRELRFAAAPSLWEAIE
jgi:hypothetical protein